ncbi:MAG: RNA polymerase sigma factor [Candidatus Eisenbacteria bacterium]
MKAPKDKKRPPAREKRENRAGEGGGPDGPEISWEVLEGVRRRDQEALGEFFERTFDRIYGLALRLLGDPTAAEDLTQEVFLRVHRSADRLDPDRDPMPWLRTITANLCRDHRRSFGAKVAAKSISFQDPEGGLGEKLANGRANPEGNAVAAERERLVQAAIDRLPEQLREVVVLRDYEGLDHEAIAGIVGASGPAVRKRYSRALARLGELLEDVLK